MVNNPLSPVNMGIYNDFCPQSARRKWRKYAFSSKKACTLRAKIMYKTPDYEYEQLSFTSFNATCGMQLDPDNEWIRISKKLPWRAWESLYSVLFQSDTGNVAKPCRMVIGSLILQMRMGFTDRDLVLQIQQNPYYQYFALKAYKYRTGFYPERVLVDQIYRTRCSIAFCNENGIRISGPKPGRPVLDDEKSKKDLKISSKDNSDRIEIERYFSTAKRRNGMGQINRKRKDTSLSTIAMSVLVTNIFGTFKSAVEEYEAEIASAPSKQKNQGRKLGLTP